MIGPQNSTIRNQGLTKNLNIELYKTRLSRLGFEAPDSTPDSSLSPLNAKQHIFDLLAQSETDIFSAYKAVVWRFLKLLSHLERECVDLQTIGSDNWGITEQE